ncbi:uncharacterized protein A4U43_C02F2520 [Asparagus officinalis]|uniref:Uncharacterized protein n=1 Tax=Asparagus officinalis TaxID=4686 RepID=A0A5P1FG55_ASPOF|nr:uncharacterized protein A4U43_C02F2520 [Asparagus officinalis]
MHRPPAKSLPAVCRETSAACHKGPRPHAWIPPHRPATSLSPPSATSHLSVTVASVTLHTSLASSPTPLCPHLAKQVQRVQRTCPGLRPRARREMRHGVWCGAALHPRSGAYLRARVGRPLRGRALVQRRSTSSL